MSDLLLDTNVVVALVNQTVAKLPQRLRQAMSDPSAKSHVSVASLWELAIKSRLGKLELLVDPADVAAYLVSGNIGIIDIAPVHATLNIAEQPPTRDPFDRLLLAVCEAERLKLLTADTALADHRLAY
jgi:PIN domain nuclease of toxin-antitoxin system